MNKGKACVHVHVWVFISHSWPGVPEFGQVSKKVPYYSTYEQCQHCGERRMPTLEGVWG